MRRSDVFSRFRLKRPSPDPDLQVASCLAAVQTALEAGKTLAVRVDALEEALARVTRDRAAESATMLDVVHRLGHAHKRLMGRIAAGFERDDAVPLPPTLTNTEKRLALWDK